MRKNNDYLWFKVICIELLLGEVRTRALVPLVVSHNDADPPSVHVFLLARVLALSFLTARAGLVILLATLCYQEYDCEYKDQSSTENYSSSSWNDHPWFWNGPASTCGASSNFPHLYFSCSSAFMWYPVDVPWCSCCFDQLYPLIYGFFWFLQLLNCPANFSLPKIVLICQFALKIWVTSSFGLDIHKW